MRRPIQVEPEHLAHARTSFRIAENAQLTDTDDTKLMLISHSFVTSRGIFLIMSPGVRRCRVRFKAMPQAVPQAVPRRFGVPTTPSATGSHAHLLCKICVSCCDRDGVLDSLMTCHTHHVLYITSHKACIPYGHATQSCHTFLALLP